MNLLFKLNRVWRKHYKLITLVTFVSFLLFSQRNSLLAKTWSNFGFIALNWSLSQAQEDRLNVAKDYFQNSLLVENNHSAWRGLSLIYLESNHLNEAIVAWQKSNQPVELLIKGRVLSAVIQEQSGNKVDALLTYQQAIDIGSLSGVKLSEPYFYSGMVYQRLLEPEHLDEARKLYEEALSVNHFDRQADKADCHYHLAEVMRWQGEIPSKYIPHYKTAADLNPKHFLARVWLGTSIYNDSQNLGMAEREIRFVLDQEPSYYLAYIHLGDLYRLEGQLDEARELYETAISIDDQREDAYKRLSWLDNMQVP